MTIFVCASVGSFPHIAYLAKEYSTIIFTNKRLEARFSEFLLFLKVRRFWDIRSVSDMKVCALNNFQFERITVSSPAYFFEDHSDYLLIAFQRWLSERSIACHLVDRYNLDIAKFLRMWKLSYFDRLKLSLRGMRCSDIAFLSRESDVREITSRKEPLLKYYTWTSITRFKESSYTILKKLGCEAPDANISRRILFLDSPNDMRMSSELHDLLKPYHSLITVKPHPNEPISIFAQDLLKSGSSISPYKELPAELLCFMGIRLVVATRDSTAYDAFVEASIPIISLERLWIKSAENRLFLKRNVSAPQDIVTLKDSIKRCVESL